MCGLGESLEKEFEQNTSEEGNCHSFEGGGFIVYRDFYITSYKVSVACACGPYELK